MAVYYVSTSGNNGNTGLDIAHPWQTLAYAEANATNPGDIIALKKGDTWTGTVALGITHGGTDGHPIVWDGGLWGTGNNATIQLSGDAGTCIVAFESVQYVTFQNIIVDGNSHYAYGGIVIGGYDGMASGTVQADEQYITIQDCVIKNVRKNSWSVGILIKPWHTDIQDITIQRCDIFNIDNHGIALYPWRVGDGGNGAIKSIYRTYIGYCNIYQTGMLGNSVASGILSGSNTFYDIIEHNHIYYGGGGLAPGIDFSGSIEGGPSQNGIVRYNLIESNSTGILLHQGGAITVDIYYNIIKSINKQGIEIQSSTPDYVGAIINVYNNTFYTATAYGAFQNRSTVASTATFKNNLCYSEVVGQYTGYVVTCNTAGNTVHSNNLLYRTEATNCYHILDGISYTRTTASTWEVTVVVTDPKFVTNFTDLHLQAGSPAIDKGIDVGLILDYDGYIVPFGLFPDIGCYEYGSAPPLPPPPPPPLFPPSTPLGMKIGDIRLNISHCTEGIYLRWWFNGWHYYNFQNGYDVSMQTESLDTQTTRMFSRISKVEHPTKLKAEYSYQITLEGITSGNIRGFAGLLLAERVEQYEDYIWREVEITRGDHLIKDEDTGFYILNFEITRKELPDTPAVYQKSQHLFLGDTECDLDTDEIIPINKQVNDIAEMQDRQSDFTAQFRIRKTREMRALFELSGEVGITTSFPYQNQYCKYIQNGIEMITAGIMLLERADDQYYYVSIVSGNLNFFKDIENLKLTDLLLPSTNHDWVIADQKDSHDNDFDYLYPLCEPSDDGGILPLRLAGNTVEAFGGWIWPFVKVKTIWDEIIAPYWCEGDILTNNIFLNLWMPITSMKINKDYCNGYLYSGFRRGYMDIAVQNIFGTGGTGPLSIILGDALFATGHYTVPFTANIKIVVNITFLAGNPQLYLYVNAVNTSTFNRTWFDATHATHEWTRAATAGEDLAVWGDANTYFNIEIAIVDISDASITFGSPFVSHLFLPDMTQIDFVKMICNMFGLIPDYIPRDRKMIFWNYLDLYRNIPIARDWSAYLSEREDETEFKFGDYAQNNYLKYKESDDVLKDNGRGNMLVEDETLPINKDILEVPISTCDEVDIATTLPMTVSRIAFNKFEDADAGDYRQEKTIDARIVYCKRATGRLFRIWDDALMSVGSVDVDDPKIACSVDVSFSSLVTNYASLSRMLTKTNLRRAKFNLPVYEVAGLKHYIPVYLSQYKAYFYVNKINNYVPGKLCIVDLIKL